MRKSLLTTAIFSSVVAAALVSASAMAHMEFNNECDVNLDGQLQYQRGVLVITTEADDKIQINPDYTLYVNDEKASLNEQQQQWVTDYYQSIETAVPMTVEIASEGLEVASYAVTNAFGSLLGADDDLVLEFNEFFASLSDELKQNFYAADGSYAFDSTNFEGDSDGWLGSGWASEFESRVEDLVSKSMGKIMIKIGTEMMLSGGNSEDFEAKMEKFGEDIEKDVEQRANVLEQKANALCGVLAQADYAENNMQASINGLEGLNVIEVSNYDLQK